MTFVDLEVTSEDNEMKIEVTQIRSKVIEVPFEVT